MSNPRMAIRKLEKEWFDFLKYQRTRKPETWFFGADLA